MADPRFFTRRGPFPLGELAKRSRASLVEPGTAERRIVDIAPLDLAEPEDIGFLDNRRYLDDFVHSAAGACVIHPEHRAQAPAGMALLVSETPYLAFARIARAFYPTAPPEPGIAASAQIDAGAALGEGCRVDAGAVIGARCEIGPRTHVAANVTVAPGCVIGADCTIGPNASLSHALIGDRVVIYPGARIGQAGFGFATGADGHVRIPQVGRVVIEDDVEVGANTTIDRGSARDTVIGAGSMIDNLVQIGHNVVLGRGCVLSGQVGISGSTRLDDFVACGGQVGLAGHLHVGAGAQLAARAGVMHDIPPGATWGGTPAVPFRQWMRQTAVLARLAKERGRR